MTKEKDRCTKENHRTQEEKINCIKRLNRIEGQIKGINKMIKDERHCDEILIQISAVTNALKNLGIEVLLNHMKTCMVEDIKNEKLESIDEVIKLTKRMVKWKNIDITY